jgi:hypothetical protein
MKIRFAVAVTVLATLALGACSSMSPEECAATDWTAIGYEDGARGLSSDSFASHRKACAKHGVTADFRAYQEGRDEGLLEFCQPGRGYNLGMHGGSYGGVCDPAREPAFLDAYRMGYQLYTLRSNVNHANARIAAKERELDAIETTIRDKRALLIAEDTTVQDRVLILADLEELSGRTGEIETEITVLIEERAVHEMELAQYENSVAAYDF